MSAFQPRISPDGRIVASGFGRVFVNWTDGGSPVEVSPGTGLFAPHWVGNRRLLACTDGTRQNDTRTYAIDALTLTASDERIVAPFAMTDMTAHEGAFGGQQRRKFHWFTVASDQPIDAIDGGVGALGFAPWPARGYITGWSDAKPVVIVQDGIARTLTPGPAVELRACPGAYVWRGSRGRIALWTEATGVRDVTVSAEGEFWPVVWPDGSGQPWVLSHDHSRLLLRHAGASEGYVVATGITKHPDLRWRNDWQAFVVAFDDGRGRVQIRTVDPRTPRVSLLGSVPPVPDPPRPPRPPSPPTPEPAMELPESVYATVVRFAAAFPIPQGQPGAAHEQRCRDWSITLAQQIAHDFGPDWGGKRASPTRPISKDSLALRRNGLHSWDTLRGAGTGTPTLAAEPQYHDISGQVFVPVEAFNHLAAQPTVDEPDTPVPPHPPRPAPALSFDETLAIMQEAAAQWRALHVAPGTPQGHLLLDEGQCHLWLWRLLVEGYSRERLLASVT